MNRGLQNWLLPELLIRGAGQEDRSSGYENGANGVAAIVQLVLMVMWFICWCFTIISFSFKTPGLWQEELTKHLKTVCFLRSSIASNSLKQQDRLTLAHGSSCGFMLFFYR